jgi:Rod binding domain-containing protein
MSATGSDITLGTIGSSAGIPNLNVATVPANIRNGGSTAMKAYSQGLAFEDMLVNELSQQLSKTMFGGTGVDGSSLSDGSSSAGGSSGTDGSSSSSMLGGASAYASMIPQTLTSSIMSNGGLGMAESFAQELDPALLTQASAAAGSSGTGTSGTGTSGTGTSGTGTSGTGTSGTGTGTSGTGTTAPTGAAGTAGQAPGATLGPARQVMI